MTVLIEDDPSIRKLVEYSLSSNGISIVSFPSGEEAFESDLKDAELFILDIMLPGMDGMEILSRIRKDPTLGRVPVIMPRAANMTLPKVLMMELMTTFRNPSEYWSLSAG